MLLALLLSATLSVAHSTNATPGVVTPLRVVSRPSILPTPQFRRYGTLDGLPSSSVYSIAQDADGAMWFGTKGGVARYDGVDFKVFRHRAGNPGSLRENGVANLLVDHLGRIWAVGLEAGLNRYDPVSGDFLHWEHNLADPSSLSSDKVWTIAEDAVGSLWVGTAVGLDRMGPDGRFEHIVNPLLGPKASDFGMVSVLYLAADGQLWIGSDRGVFRRDRQGKLHEIRAEGSSQPIDAWSINGNGDEIRIAGPHNLFFAGKDDVARPFGVGQIPDTNVLTSVRDHAGRLWIGTQRGLFLQDGADAPVTAVLDKPVLYGNLPGTWVWTLQVDREGGLWIGLLDGGLAYLAPGWNSFSRYTHIPDDPASLRDSIATAVARGGDGKVWVGERAGRVDKLDPVTGHIKHVLSGLSGDVIGLTEDAQNRLWVVLQGGILRYANGKTTPVHGEAAGLSRPLEVELGPDGLLYARSFREGVFRIDQRTLKVTPVPIQPAIDSARWGNQLTLRDGVFWYASDFGLSRLAADRSHFEPVPGVPANAQVDGFDFDGDKLWLARPDALERYRMDGTKLVLEARIDAAHGWPSVNVLNLAVDERSRVWIFGRDGLWCFDPATGRFRALGMRDGLSNGEFYRGYAKMPDGRIYAPTLGGVIAFNPSMRDTPAEPPPLAITGIRLRGPHGLQQLPPPPDGLLRLDWRNRGLSVEARAFSYIDPSVNQYRFRLSGIDPGWVDSGNRGERDFGSLEAGEYTLQVRATGANGDWGSLAQPLRIEVQAPPWARWWAWLGYFLLGLLLIWAITMIWRRRLAQRHQIQLAEQRGSLAEQANAAKTQFLATLSHEIRTPMTGVLGMAELLLATGLDSQQHVYAETIQRSGDLLLRLLNDALDLARIEAGRMTLEKATFNPRELLEEVAQLERVRAGAKGLSFELKMSERVPFWLSGDVLRIRQILANLANNALKFTERGGVVVTADYLDGELSLSVGDTGPGIPEAAQARLFLPFEQGMGPQRRAGSGLGLAICRELASLMGGSIGLESRVAHGSVFYVRLPLPVSSAPSGSPAPAPALAHHAGVWKVLLVEDDAIVAAVISGLLRAQGHSVIYVNNSLGALAELSRNGFDVMLLDLDLPGVDGFQLARIVRQRGVEWQLPIIAISARSGGDEEQRCREAGIDGFLRKPLTGEQLATALASKLESGKT